MTELWCDIEGYIGLYKVSSCGNVYSVRSNKNLKTTAKRNGYLSVSLCRNGKQKGFNVHRLVAMALIINPEGKPCVNHINSDRGDNRLENLEWCTRSENMYHAAEFGYVGRGEGNQHAILNDMKCLTIRTCTNFKTHKLAEHYKVSRHTVCNIRSGKNWKHLPLGIQKWEGKRW